MLSSLFRSKSGRHQHRSNHYSRYGNPGVNFGDQEEQQQFDTEQEYSEGSDDEGEEDYEDEPEPYDEEMEDEEVNEDDEVGPLLPIFSAAHLGTFFTGLMGKSTGTNVQIDRSPPCVHHNPRCPVAHNPKM